MKSFLISKLKYADIFLAIFVYPAAILLKAIRRVGLGRLPLCKRALMKVGVFPIANHYYEPLFDSSLLRNPLDEDRSLPGIDWNVEEQLALLKNFSFVEELRSVPLHETSKLSFYMNNKSFESGDAEFLYNMVRFKKPSRIFEIGSGHSTLMAIKAIEKNRELDPSYRCKHVCIEPYEMLWLEKTNVTVIRSKVECIDKNVFSELSAGDILFIDSSHMIRPQGDVLFEYLELLPILNKGVIVHIHDIFSPKDYLEDWIKSSVLFWNEQYLLEAFLSNNNSWKIIGAVNYLHHNHYPLLQSVCPFLNESREPGSFYIEKTI